LELVRRHGPDLVLSDVVMPVMDGLELCRQLKKAAATRLVPVVLVTGMDDREARIQGINAGADDFLLKPVNVQELSARVRSLIRLKRFTDELDSAEAMILSLARTVEARDPYTRGHCDRMATYAAAFGAHLQLPPEQIVALHRGGYLHDVGKIGLPDSILLKPGPLTLDERAAMKRHTLIGDGLCTELKLLRLVRPIVRHHHERLDGSGYPDGFLGETVPLLAQIMGIVDVFDAMTTDRPYRAAVSPEVAAAELVREAREGWRRRDLVEEFLQMARTEAMDLPCTLPPVPMQ
jgi:putative two-component system response regulator